MIKTIIIEDEKMIAEEFKANAIESFSRNRSTGIFFNGK